MAILETVIGWGEAIKGFLVALPGVVRIWEWWHNRMAGGVEQREKADADNETNDVAAARGPGGARAAGRALRDRMRDSK